MNNKGSVIIEVLLGVLIGVLLTLIAQRAIEKNHLRRTEYRDWRKLNLVLQEVDRNYVDTINVKDVTDAAIEAALAKLDPHSLYMPPVELEEAQADLEGNFDGIGIQFNVPNDTAIVLEVISGGPSEKVGLLPGDRILKVNDKVIAGVKFPQDSIVRRIKGPAGTKVKLLINRNNSRIPFEITRGKIPVHSIDAALMVDDSTGYIRLSKFSRTTYEEFKEASSKLLSQGMKRLVFDLRDNTGGYFDQALLLSNEFLDKNSKIVYMQGRHRKREDFKADGSGDLRKIRLITLINESTASSSEIFSGAMQDNDRGVIVGRRSFGKGLVQEPFNFTDGSGIRLTVARYYTPSGRCIQKPYSKDYDMEIVKRYEDGEVFSRDSMKVDTSEAYKTVHGRTVYGGGGIVPDVFVPVDTTRASDFFVKCNKKTTQMRYASYIFDTYKKQLLAINDYRTMDAFLSRLDIPVSFQRYAADVDKIVAKPGEWKATESYLMPQLKALIARYSKLGDNAFYKYYMSVDETFQKALKSPSVVSY